MGSRAPDRIRVLVVDDEEDFATATATRLDHRGFAAQVALSGRAAIEAVAHAPFDVVILDLLMPELDGIETLRELRRIDPHVEVVFLTGHGTVASGIEGMQLGAADFLQKPVSIEVLCTAVDAAAERSRAGRERRREGGDQR